MNEEIIKKVNNSSYYEKGNELRYVKDKKGEYLLGLEAIDI